MKIPARKKKQVILPQSSEMPGDDEYSCYEEDFFLEFLIFERRRSERSGRPFLVMTMEFTRILDLESRRESVRWAMQTLSVLTRDTDIKGWYKNPMVLGVIFTEMNSLETETLQKKINESLSARLSAEQLDDIQLSFHRFPEDGKPNKPGGPISFTFYPEYPKKERSHKNALKMKRMIDVLGGIVGLLIYSPFFLLIPLCIKLTSRGPVLFRQERIGQYGKKFIFLKFRSMFADNDEEVHKQYVQDLIAGKVSGETGDKGVKQKVYKITNDKRVTPLGNILRKTSLDELPQFINVLKGEMSLVGPRPPIPYELEKYDTWHRRRVLEVKPGITGLWQVTGRSSTTFDEMVRIDLQYATNWSIWFDVKILLKTTWIVIAGKGAY
ncbi:MAG: sugar transferase [Nitrospirae bacterium]|nr:sugar transferase [Nitrospirota bacterium]